MKKIAYAAAALGAAAATLVAPTAPAHADPCFFGGGEFDNWYNGARWGDTLSHVEGVYANCVGTWDSYSGTWKGNPEKRRVWPRSDGGQTWIFFAYNNGAWHAHDEAETSNVGVVVNWTDRDVCEWPRPDGNPCTPS